jgi:hypothetical protein
MAGIEAEFLRCLTPQNAVQMSETSAYLKSNLKEIRKLLSERYSLMLRRSSILSATAGCGAQGEQLPCARYEFSEASHRTPLSQLVPKESFEHPFQ